MAGARWPRERRYWATTSSFTRQRDELSRQRRELPWVKVEASYFFDTWAGKKTLAGLFQGAVS